MGLLCAEDRCYDEVLLRGYIDIAHALLRHFEEVLATKQRLTAGSLKCAESVCKALHKMKHANPRLELLVQRISSAIVLLHKRKSLDERNAPLGGTFCVTRVSTDHEVRKI